jgi:hypothetical protein
VTNTVTNVINGALKRALKRIKGLPVRRPGMLRCQWCRNRYAVKPRGREPAYCSRSCRQRAYESRKAAEGMPRRLLQAELARHDLQLLVQQEVRAYLRSYVGSQDAERRLNDILQKYGLDEDSVA